MNPLRLAALLLLALPLAACASSTNTHDDVATTSSTNTHDDVATTSAVEAQRPEVRYYVIADT
ncbi:MAG: hypothetical protein H6831_08165 [Planctomycetes bacterium]|nr:hypothetical protein [Planctomycetota bacterium]MCB9904366.1 hypothetical protein [Planctomycetota bacterium]